MMDRALDLYRRHIAGNRSGIRLDWDARPLSRKLMEFWWSLTWMSHNWLFRTWEKQRNMWAIRENGENVDVMLKWDARVYAGQLRAIRNMRRQGMDWVGRVRPGQIVILADFGNGRAEQ